MEVHRCRFVDWVPEDVESLAFTQETGASERLAVGRRGGSIEVYRRVERAGAASSYSSSGTPFEGSDGESGGPIWYRERDIAGEGEGNARSLAWGAGRRLFSGSLAGSVVEWSLDTMGRLRTSQSFGGAVWGIAASPDGTALAAACEDGAVRVFDLWDDSDVTAERPVPCLRLRTTLARRKERILCVCWSPDGTTVFAGTGAGVVCGWDVHSGHSVFTATLEVEGSTAVDGSSAAIANAVTSGLLPLSSRARANAAPLIPRPASGGATVVWAIACVGDSTVVTGDSAGKTLFWDVGTGTLLQAFKEHQSDVLTVAAHPSGHFVFSASVDAKMCVFQREQTATTGLERWVCRGGIRRHTHDVKTLAWNREGDVLASGSVDTQVALFSLESIATGKTVSLIRPVPTGAAASSPITTTAADARILLVRQPQSLHLWKLGDADVPGHATAAALARVAKVTPLELNHDCVHLLDFELSKLTSQLVCSAISTKATYLACSDRAAPFRLWKLSFDNGSASTTTTTGSGSQLITVKAERIHIPELAVPAYRLAFSADERCMFVLGFDRSLAVVDLESRKVIFREKKKVFGDMCFSVATSLDGSRFAVACLDGTVHVYFMSGTHVAHESTVPALGAPLCALAFNADSTLLVLVSCESRVYVWNVTTRSQTPFSAAINRRSDAGILPPEYSLPVSVAVNPGQTDTVVIISPFWIASVPIAQSALPDGVIVQQQEEQESSKTPKKARTPRQAGKKRAAAGDGDDAMIDEDRVEVPRAVPAKKPVAVSPADASLLRRSIDVVRVLKRYQVTLGGSFVGNNEFVVVERPWVHVLQKLPDPFNYTHFGS